MNSIFVKYFPATHPTPIPQTVHSFPFIDQKKLFPPRLHCVIPKNNESQMILVEVANLNSSNVTSSQSIFPLLHAPLQEAPIRFPVRTTQQYQHVSSQQRINLPVDYTDVRKRKDLIIVNTNHSHDAATSGMRTQPFKASNAQGANINKAREMENAGAAHKEFDKCVKNLKKEKFPKVLYQLLVDATKHGNEDIICFLPHGRSFILKDIEKFETIVMPKYFKMSVWKSFRRQLNLYDFTRVTCGPDRGSYYHKSFVRGKPELLDDIKRIKLKGERSKNLPGYIAPKNPNFYLESEERGRNK